MTEFWPELLTKASWQKLQHMKSEIRDFIVIGGWAFYLWTGMHKSKDIDIIVDFKVLEKLKQKYELVKNLKLRKYEIKFDKFDIDIYVSHFSKFALPIEAIKKTIVQVQGFSTPRPEVLLILKQGAEITRRGSVKGEKDAIDIITLLNRAPFDMDVYATLIKKYGLTNYAVELAKVIKSFDARHAEHVGMSYKEFNKWKKDILAQLKKFSL
jgi:heme exporter protein D